MSRSGLPGRVARLLVRPLLLVGGLVIAIALGELLLCVALPAGVNEYYPWPPRLSREFRPDPAVVGGISGVSRFTINSWGLRGDEFAADQGYRILALGGSTTECLYLDDTETWPHLLQERLTREGGRGRVWVGNAAKSGHTSREHYAHLLRLPPQYPKLDAALLLVGANDLALFLHQGPGYDPDFMETARGLAITEYRAFSIYPDQSLPEFFEATGYGRLWTRLRGGPLRMREAEGLVMDEVGAVYAEARRRRAEAPVMHDRLPDLAPALAAYERQLVRLIELCHSQDLHPVFLTQPTLWRQDLTPEEEALLWFGYVRDSPEFYSAGALAEGMARFNEKLLEVSAARGVECLDLARQLPRDAAHFYDDMHFTEAGSRAVAERVGAYLLSRPPFAE